MDTIEKTREAVSRIALFRSGFKCKLVSDSLTLKCYSLWLDLEQTTAEEAFGASYLFRGCL